MKVFRLWSNLFCLFCFVSTSTIIKWQCKMIILMRIFNVIIFTYRSQRLPLMLINVHIISFTFIYLPISLESEQWLGENARTCQACHANIVTGSSEKCRPKGFSETVDRRTNTPMNKKWKRIATLNLMLFFS